MSAGEAVWLERNINCRSPLSLLPFSSNISLTDVFLPTETFRYYNIQQTYSGADGVPNRVSNSLTVIPSLIKWKSTGAVKLDGLKIVLCFEVQVLANA